MVGYGRFRLARHRERRLTGHAPRKIDARAPAPQSPERRAGELRAKIPHGDVDHRLGEIVLADLLDL